ncbi:MAG: SH3 domain-containing protein [Paracoccaceae bacterium]
MIRTALLISMLAIGTAAAQQLPAAFQVTGVAQDDVLNIRAEPSASSAIIGEIFAYDIAVEVLRLSDDGKWGLVGAGERNGWVATRFLKFDPSPEPYLVPRPLTCSGTEPFWTIGLYPRGSEFSAPDTPRTDIEVKAEGVADAGFYAVAEEGPTRIYRLNVTRQICSDGMSDREYGWAASLFIESPDGNRMLSGCCSLDSRF